jgi:hypothetical protein
MVMVRLVLVIYHLIVPVSLGNMEISEYWQWRYVVNTSSADKGLHYVPISYTVIINTIVARRSSSNSDRTC